MTIVRWAVPVLAVLALSGCGQRQKVTTSSEAALAMYERGVALYENFYYREALASIDSALAADSLFALAWVRRAVISFSTRDQESALREIGRALALSGGVSRAEGMLIRMWGHRIRYEQREAADVADSLIDRYPYLREAYLVRGQLYEWEKNEGAAIRMYEKALAMDSTYAQAVMSIGYAYSGQGDVGAAIAYMERYIRLLPHEADPRASYGDVLLRAGRYDEALAQYKASLVVRPAYWYSMQKIGDVSSILGKLKQAEAYYDSGLVLMPGGRQIDVMRLVIRGRLDFLRADYERAAEQLRSALAIDSTAGDAAFRLVYALVRLGKLDAAEELTSGIRAELLRRNLFESPSRAGYELVRSVVLREQGKFGEALAACDLALQYSPQLSRAYIFDQRAEVHLSAKEYERALDACEEALSLNPNSPDVLLTLVKIYHAKKDVKMTVEIGGRLLALWAGADPDFHPLRELQQIIGRTPLAAR